MDVLPLALNIIDTSFTMHGMALNYSKGKSEILMCYAGEGSAKLKKGLYTEYNQTLRFHEMNEVAKSINDVHT